MCALHFQHFFVGRSHTSSAQSPHGSSGHHIEQQRQDGFGERGIALRAPTGNRQHMQIRIVLGRFIYNMFVYKVVGKAKTRVQCNNPGLVALEFLPPLSLKQWRKAEGCQNLEGKSHLEEALEKSRGLYWWDMDFPRHLPRTRSWKKIFDKQNKTHIIKPNQTKEKSVGDR